MADIRVHIDTLEYTRQGLKTRDPISLQVGQHNRVVLIRPERAPSFVATHGGFPEGLSFPGAAVLSLLLHEHRLGNSKQALAATTTSKLQVFGHTDSTGSESSNKELADRRAQVLLALLTRDRDTFMGIAKTEAWATPFDQLMMRALGCDPGPLDGVHQELTEAATTRFQDQYVTRAYHQADDDLLLPELGLDGVAGPQTFEALLDAYLHRFSSRFEQSRILDHGANGCAAFNLASSDATNFENRRVSLVVHQAAPLHPNSTPCTEGDSQACPVLPAGVPASCFWFREHVLDSAPPSAIHHNFLPSWLPLTHGKFMLSVLTTLPEGTEVVFEVFPSEGRVTVPSLRPSRIAATWPTVEITGVVTSGVAQVVWDPPQAFAPGSDGRFEGTVPTFAASHVESHTVSHASFPAHVISILLEIPLNLELPTFEGTLLLSDSQGAEVTFTAADAVPYDAEHLAFRLEGALQHERYTLIRHLPNLDPVVLFEDVPFEDLERGPEEELGNDDGSSDEQSIDFDAFMQIPELAAETQALFF